MPSQGDLEMFSSGSTQQAHNLSAQASTTDNSNINDVGIPLRSSPDIGTLAYLEPDNISPRSQAPPSNLAQSRATGTEIQIRSEWSHSFDLERSIYQFPNPLDNSIIADFNSFYSRITPLNELRRQATEALFQADDSMFPNIETMHANACSVVTDLLNGNPYDASLASSLNFILIELYRVITLVEENAPLHEQTEVVHPLTNQFVTPAVVLALRGRSVSPGTGRRLLPRIQAVLSNLYPDGAEPNRADTSNQFSSQNSLRTPPGISIISEDTLLPRPESFMPEEAAPISLSMFESEFNGSGLSRLPSPDYLFHQRRLEFTFEGEIVSQPVWEPYQDRYPLFVSPRIHQEIHFRTLPTTVLNLLDAMDPESDEFQRVCEAGYLQQQADVIKTSRQSSREGETSPGPLSSSDDVLHRHSGESQSQRCPISVSESRQNEERGSIQDSSNPQANDMLFLLRTSERSYEQQRQREMEQQRGLELKF